jgi:hypothetical protein
MYVYILILITATNFNGHEIAAITQEFTSKTTCEAAQNLILKNQENLTIKFIACVQK